MAITAKEFKRLLFNYGGLRETIGELYATDARQLRIDKEERKADELAGEIIAAWDELAEGVEHE